MIKTTHPILTRLVAMTLMIAALLPAARTAQGLAPGAPDNTDPASAVGRASTAPATAGYPDFGRLPIYFVENHGQTDPEVAYYVLSSGSQIYFTREGVTFALAESGNPSDSPPQRWTVKLDFVGANRQASPSGEDQTEAVVSYFTGAPDQWHAGLPTFARVVYRDLWPGIDLAYYNQEGRLKYDFLVHPGADPGDIRLRYRGADNVDLNAAGQMEVTTPLGAFTDDAPIAWQDVSGERVPVFVSFDLRDQPSVSSHQPPAISQESSFLLPASSFGFSLGAYDPLQPLVIDPAVMIYCGYIGGSGTDDGYDIAVDPDGNAYVVGSTTSAQTSFPVAVGPDVTQNGGTDVFVAKVNASGTALVYAGYIGGSGSDYGDGVAVDSAGNAYVTGFTNSTEATFPDAVGPDTSFNGGWDGFVAKVNATGTALDYCGYIGGSGSDYGYGIAVDGAGNAYVAGTTASTEATFPEVGGPDTTHNGSDDAFVAKVNTSGTLVYAGYIGGSDKDEGNDIAVDVDGNAYVVGHTSSTAASFPETVGPDLSQNGLSDAFVAKVNPGGTALVYAGYIGGSESDYGYGIALGNTGSVYVTGVTMSADFPAIVGPDLTYNYGDLGDAFVAKVSASGAGLVYAGYIGGSDDDAGYGIAVDDDGNAYVTGSTISTEASFPVTGGPDGTHNGGFYDAYVAKVIPSGAALAYCGYIGGSGPDLGEGIAVDGDGNAYITGQTQSAASTFPVLGGLDPTYNGGQDAFLAKVGGKPTYLPLVRRN